MRIWEFDDKKETPSDLVREQDFIMRVRRMQRAGMPCLVLNFILTAIEPLAKSSSALEEAQKKLKAYAASTNGAFFDMSNGDVFLAWENPGEARLVASRAIDAALAEYKNNITLFLVTYRMPENYALLRERANTYIEEVRTKTAAGESPEKVDESTGRLTSKNVLQIERILAEADVRKYGRSQNMYRDAKSGWTQVAEEYFISLEDMRRENFPKLDIAGSEHFFFAICSLLDQKLLSAMTTSYSTIAGRTVNLNLSIASIMGSVFAQFVRCVPRDQRHLIGFELHCGDLLQDFSVTLSAIEVLRREGFRVTIDSTTPNMAAYIEFGKFPVDRIKVNVDKDRISQFLEPSVRKGLERISPDRLIFFHCDNDRSVALGREMGVTIFQGWLIDEYVAKTRKKT
jgi:hypothetical protein